MPVPLGITTSLALTNTLTRTQSANVLGVLTRQRSRARRRVRDLLGASRSPRHRRAESGFRPERQDLQRRARQRERRRHGARDRQRARGAAAAAAALDHAVVRRRRGAGPLGSQYYADASDRPAGQDGCEHQLRQRQHLGRDARHHAHRAWQVEPRRRCDDGRRPSKAHASRAISSPTAASYYRSDQFNFAKIGVPAFYFSAGTDFVDRPAGWGARADRARTTSATTTSRATSSRPTGTSTAWCKTRSSASWRVSSSRTPTRCRRGTRATSSRRRVQPR